MNKDTIRRNGSMSWAKASLICGIIALITSWSFMFIPISIFWPILGGYALGTCAVNYYIFQKTDISNRTATAGLIIGCVAIFFCFSWIGSLESELKGGRMFHHGEWEVVGEWVGSKSKQTEVFSVPKKWGIFWQVERDGDKNGGLQVSVYSIDAPKGNSEQIEGVMPEEIAVGDRVPFNMLVNTTAPDSGWPTRSGYAHIFPHSEHAKKYMDGEVYLVIRAKDCDWIVKAYGIPTDE